MSIIKLTKDLENFQWTDYDNTGDNTSQIKGRHGGTLPGGQPPHPSDHSELDDGSGVPQSFYDGHSRVVTGKKEFERPNRGALADMESRFGPLNTQPLNRGPYGVTDNMDGTKQGRGFTPPGGHPEGFTVDMGESKYVIGDPLEMTLTPLSYTIAGITSNGPHGTVPEHSIDVQFGTTWSSPSVVDAWAENFMVPPLSQYVSQHSIEQNNPPITRTFNVSDAYPNNDKEYSVNTQFGWSWPEGSEYLGIHGTPWRGFKLTETVGNQIDTVGLENVVPEWYPSPPTQVSHPVNHIYLNSEPSPAPSYLQAQFLVNYGLTDGIWPYKVLDYDPGPHPLIRRDIGTRWDINGVSSWMALQAMRTGDDITRIEKWLKTPVGREWKIKQHMLQELNPRPEVRSWSHASLIGSLVPLVHMDRHGTLSEGRDYMHYDPIMSRDKRKYGFGVRFGDESSQDHETRKGGAYEGRLWRLTEQFVFGSAAGDSSIAGSIAGAIVGAIQAGLASLRYGGPTDTPTQVVFSQRGPFGEHNVNIGPYWVSGEEAGDWNQWQGLSELHSSKNLPHWLRQVGIRGQDYRYVTLPYEGLTHENSYGLADRNKYVDFSMKRHSNILRHSWRFFNVEEDSPYYEDDSYFSPSSPLESDIKDLVKDNTWILKKDSRHSELPDGTETSRIDKYKMLSYGDLGKWRYEKIGITPQGLKNLKTQITDATRGVEDLYEEFKKKEEIYNYTPGHGYGTMVGESNMAMGLNRVRRRQAMEKAEEDWKSATSDKEKLEALLPLKTASQYIVDGIGHPGRTKTTIDVPDGELGIIKKTEDGSYKTDGVDKINILPYGQDYPKDDPDTAKIEEQADDFIKFKFYDIHNDKFIIFRAILSGISDSITPEWTGTKYIGRPDQVYVYAGAERKISFNFEIYPKTKQEFPVLLEKMNYLVGLCYPSFTSNNRMIAPFIQLTIGDMFNRTPGFLDSLSIDVDDASTWELDEGLQFPKHITCQCSFTYVGKYLPSTLGKHYGLGWLEDKGWSSKGSKMLTKGTFELNDDNPSRIGYSNLFKELGAENAQ